MFLCMTESYWKHVHKIVPKLVNELTYWAREKSQFLTRLTLKGVVQYHRKMICWVTYIFKYLPSFIRKSNFKIFIMILKVFSEISIFTNKFSKKCFTLSHQSELFYRDPLFDEISKYLAYFPEYSRGIGHSC